MLLTLTPVSQATYHFPLQAIKTGGMQWLSYSLEPKLFFSLQSYKTKSRMKSLGSRLAKLHVGKLQS